jgi:phosphopantothenoylcysteine decarboxylase/phosphopantothenate--cysteine ligase
MDPTAKPQTPERTKRVLVGVTGGIAAYKTAELVRLLIKAGVEVQVVMTQAAQQFVTPLTFQALTGRTVLSDLWEDSEVNGKSNRMSHIELTRSIDLVLVAPATADFIARLALGLANDLLSTLCLARPTACPLLVAPAMNHEMWLSPATARNIARLEQDGAIILGPDSGEQACGESGPGRMLEPQLLADRLLARFSPRPLTGKRVMVTAGPTFEAIDPVRGITNRSSGKMGYAIAQAALDAGAEVTLVTGPTALAPPANAHTIQITSVSQMFNEVNYNIAGVDIFFAVAAVADYTPKIEHNQKLKKSSAPLEIQLVPTQDILSHVAHLPNPPFCVGFAAESENVVEYAAKKREKKEIPVIVANLAQVAIGSDDNEVVIIDECGLHPVPRDSKIKIARAIIDFVAGKLAQPRRLHALKTLKSQK